jgi:ubiquinone/menaquinone biosynthesis C-methylase UbiE
VALRNTDPKTTYLSSEPHSISDAKAYAKSDETSSRFLAYRNLPKIFQKHVTGPLSLDYGSGTGISSKFLAKQGFHVVGADISNSMLNQAKIQAPEIQFKIINDYILPEVDRSFDLLFSSFVVFELAGKQEILKYFSEAKRVLKDDGTFVIVTNSDDFYSEDWYSFRTNYPENKELKSGSLARTYLVDIGIEFTDYYWNENDILELLNNSGFNLVEIDRPLGNLSDSYPWKTEITKSPFAIFVAKKASSLSSPVRSVL